MAIAANDIIRLGLQWFMGAAGEVINVHTLRVESIEAGASDDDLVEDMIAQLVAELYTPLASAFPTELAAGIASAYNLTQSTVLPPNPTPDIGAVSTSDATSPQVTCLVFYNTGFPRRQGRTYLPPFIELAINDLGALDVGLLSDVGNAAVSVIQPLVGVSGTYQKVVAHADGSSPVVPVSVGVSGFTRTQRRRTFGRGS